MLAPRRPRALGRLSPLGLALLGVVAGGLLVAAPAGAMPVRVGSAYTETNGLAENQIVAFDRLSDGTLVEAQRVETGGFGELSTACSPPGPPICPFIDSQGAVTLTPAGTLLFAVNAGSNTISSFRVSPAGLTLVDQVSSFGDYPNSITTHGRVLYVLNQQSGNIAGFTFSATGHLTSIPGSQRPLATPGPGGDGGQVGFDRAGETLTVTERETNLIDTFQVTDGVAGPAVSHPSSAPGPFGFSFDLLGHLVVSDGGSPPDFSGGAGSTYTPTRTGGLVPIDTESTQGSAPCWTVITLDNRYVYIDNSITKTIARFRLGSDGSLTLLGLTPILNSTPGMLTTIPADEALSRDGRFLYVLVPSLYGGPVGRVDAFRVGPGGDLTLIASTPANMAPGASGLAAR